MIVRRFSSAPLRPAMVVAIAAAVAAFALPLSARQGAIDKSLFVSVIDEAGAPVKDIQLGELLIREEGADREVIAVKPASQPISVAVLVDTAQGTRVTDAYGTPEEYVRDIRVSIAAFARQLLNQSPEASVSLTEFGGAAIPVVSFTKDFAEFSKGVNRLTSKPGVASVLMEALVQANKELAERPSTRRAIVTLNLEPSDEQSREEPKKILGAFRESGAQLWALSIQRGGLKNSRRDVLINDISKNTGGQRDFIVGISAAEDIMKRYADALTYQYEIVYKRPESKKTPQVIQVGLARQGKYKIHASGYPPK
jgi:hypothetical protein